MAKPRVSVIITTYNRGELLPTAVQSVLNQTYKNYELHIVDDGSKDNTQEVVQRFASKYPNIFYSRHERNRGLPKARNTGLRMARGKYVAYLDDDDAWKPEKLQKQVALAESLDPKYAITYCGLEVRNKSGRIVSHNMPRLKGDIRDEIVQKGLNTIPSSCLFRREALEKIGGFDEDLYTGIDHDIWMKMARYGYKIDYINEALVIYTRHDRLTMTTDVRRRVTGIEQYINKWRSEILKWFGQEAGNKYCSDYYVKVIGGLGVSLVLNGDTWLGKKVLWKVLSKEPKSFLSDPRLCLGLFGGKHLYHILKRVKFFHEKRA